MRIGIKRYLDIAAGEKPRIVAHYQLILTTPLSVFQITFEVLRWQANAEISLEVDSEIHENQITHLTRFQPITYNSYWYKRICYPQAPILLLQVTFPNSQMIKDPADSHIIWMPLIWWMLSFVWCFWMHKFFVFEYFDNTPILRGDGVGQQRILRGGIDQRTPLLLATRKQGLWRGRKGVRE